MKLQMRNLSILSRIFSRTDNTAVAKVHAHAFGQPLLVHPSIGEQLVGAYLHGAVDTPPAIRMMSDDAAAVAGDAPQAVDLKQVAILNICGALVNRPMPDACGDGPTSYVAIRRAFDDAMQDESVIAVVMRMNSPGGMASGCFDLSDHIYANRQTSGGRKPVIALIDDMAYSGCYALAAACDQIWVSRTSGVGSVGVVAFHCDYSAADAKAGVKFTPIFSGARKIDFNPHFPLSPEAQQAAQADSDALYDIFITAVATYRGMDEAAVRATEAGTFSGVAGIAAGFADRQGTLHDLLAELMKPAESEQEDPQASEDAPPAEEESEDPPVSGDDVPPAPAKPEEDAARAAAAERTMRLGALSTALAASGLPGEVVTAAIGFANALAGADERSPQQVIDEASRIVDVCVAAGVQDLAADLIKEGLTAEQARKSVAALKADVGPELITAPPAGQTGMNHQPPSQWAKTISRFGGK